MITIKEKKVMAVASSLLVVLVLFIGSSSAFVQSRHSSSFNVNNRGTSTSTSTSTSIGIGAFFNEGKKKLVKSLAGEYDATAIQDRMNGLIDAEPVLMFSFTTCPFCIKAKSVLDGKNAKYTVIELDTDPDGKAIRAEMADIIGQTSVPAVWIGGEFVGG
jgi:glutaredoxin 3